MPGPAHPMQIFMLFLAGLYAAEGRPGAAIAATALIDAATGPMPAQAGETPPLALAALAIDPHPGAPLLAAALPFLRWIDTRQVIAGVKPDWAAAMLVNELLGPDGQFHHPSVRVGLYVQRAGFHYGLRTHPAEETYALLGGRSSWATGTDAPRPRPTGAFVHHPSMTPHQTLTTDAPFIAAWRWSGDISFDGYAAIDPA